MPANSWSIANLKGSREGVKNAINAHGSLEEHDKAWLCAKIDSFATEFNHVRLDAHAQVQPAKAGKNPAIVLLNLQIIPETVL